MFFGVLSTNCLAVWTIHDESAAYGGTAFIDAAIHAATIHRHAPAFLVMSHYVQSVRQMRGEVLRDFILGLQNNRQATADGIAPRAVRPACSVGVLLFHAGAFSLIRV